MTLRPGPRNLITDVDGILVGQAADPEVRSGVTVVLPEHPVVASGDVRGGGPGTRETELLDPANMVGEVHAVVLSGGSAFGLDAATGAQLWLAERGRGLQLDGGPVPIVPAAILYDLANGGDKSRSRGLPYQRLARNACEEASRDIELGTAGAAYGARSGDLKGGLGSASAVDGRGLQVGALVAVNSRGSTTIGDQPQFWAWPLEQGTEFGGLPPPQGRAPPEPPVRQTGFPGQHTTLAVVATNALLGKAEALRVAMMAQDGLARAIRPVHTPFDGDIVFSLATGRHRPDLDPVRLSERVGAIAADCLARAVARGIYLATALPGMPAWRDRFGIT